MGWVTGRKGVSDEMGGITHDKVLTFGGIVVLLPISGPAGADVTGGSENIMAISGRDEIEI